MGKDKEQQDRAYINLAIIAALIILFLWSCTFLLFYFSYDKPGEFGDMFGAVNSLFSGLAFAGIIITIYMQREELKLQREELQETRGVFERQVSLMTQQQADNTFFNLLSNHRQLVESFSKTELRFIGNLMKPSGNVKEVSTGYEVINEIAKGLKEYLDNYSDTYKRKLILDFNGKIGDPVLLLLENHELLGLYKETCNIYAFIDKNFKQEHYRNFYEETLWVNLSYSERVIFEIYHNIIGNTSMPTWFVSKYYNNFDYIDFTSCKLPQFKSRISSERNWTHTIHMESQDDILKSALVIIQKDAAGFFSLIDSVYFSPGSNRNISVSFEDLIIESKLNIDDWVARPQEGNSNISFFFYSHFSIFNTDFDSLVEIPVKIDRTPWNVDSSLPISVSNLILADSDLATVILNLIK